MKKTRIITFEFDDAADILRDGGLVALPTETVYGLAANGLDEEAVKRIYEVKGRPEDKPLSLMISRAEAMDDYCIDIPQAARLLAERLWPGPLTIVLKARENVPEIVRAGGKTIGLRCPDHTMARRVLRLAGLPLAAPSANPSGEPSAKTGPQALAYFNGKIDAVVVGKCGDGGESTVIDMSETPYRILRQGALPAEKIADVLADGVRVIGLTGGTGTGKTTALKMLGRAGALAIDCDEVYHRLTEESRELERELCERFGNVYKSGVLDRKALGNIVFGDPTALLDLNEITHKYVDREIGRMLGEHAMNGGALAAMDAVALLEGGANRRCERVCGFTAPAELRVRRVMEREGIGREYAEKRVAAQRPDSFYEENCDAIIENGGDLASFESHCAKLFSEWTGLPESVFQS